MPVRPGEQIGLGQPTPSCIEVCTAAGAILNDEGRLLFPRAMVEDTIAKACRNLVLHGQDPKHDMEIGGKRVKTGRLAEARCPHDHEHLLATWHKGGKAEVDQAVAAAAKAWPDWSRMDWQDRAHFLAVAAKAMRQVLLDQVKYDHAAKRARKDVTLVTHHLEQVAPADFCDLDDALRRLSEIDEGLAQIVELKFFSGMSNPEIAAYTRTSESTVKRQWRAARAWLLD